MSDFVLYILTALALMFVIEGLVYTLFPDSVRRMMMLALTLPPERLRVFGLAMVTAGAVIVWFMSRFIR